MRFKLFVALCFLGSVSQVKSELRIVGGQLVYNLEDFPYQVSIRQGDGIFCGGTIINENHVLTASHCVFNEKGVVMRPSTFSITTGKLTLNTRGSSHSAKFIFTHPNYSPATFQNDIAVIRIVGKFGMNKYVQPIPLRINSTPDQTPCNVSGWGSVSPGKPIVPDLRYAMVPIYPTKACNATNSYNGRIRSGMLCAGYFEGGKDACQGDSGGPLVCNGLLTGIVSWGHSCGLREFPGVYTKVSSYVKWIDQQLLRSSANRVHIGLMWIFAFAFLCREGFFQL